MFHAINLLCELDGGTSLSKAPDTIQRWYAAVTTLPEISAYLAERPKPGRTTGLEGSIMRRNAVPSQRNV